MAPSLSSLAPSAADASPLGLSAAGLATSLATAAGCGAAVGALIAWKFCHRATVAPPPVSNEASLKERTASAASATALTEQQSSSSGAASSGPRAKHKAERAGCAPAVAYAGSFRREVVLADACEWLRRPGVVPPGAFVFTSLPDVSEVKEFAPTMDAWKAWFKEAVILVLKALPLHGVAVFYQTDIRLPEQGQVSKALMVLQAALEVPGVTLWWHKIAHFGNVDQPAVTSLKFSHMLCYRRQRSESGDECSTAGDEIRSDNGGMIPDVLSRGPQPRGLKNCARSMGANAVHAVLKWAIRRLPGVDTVIDPFCGAGTALAVGNELGLHALGVDISARRVRQATALDGAALLEERGTV